MFTRNQQGQEPEPRDVIVIIKDDGTSDIVPVVEINHERILAGSGRDNEYSIPVGDAKSYVGRKGRVFVYPTTIENVLDCQRIAELEKSTTLRQITQYSPPPEEIRKSDLSKALPWLVIIILIIVVAFK